MYGKFGFMQLELDNYFDYYQGRTAGIGAAFDVNRFQSGVELDFMYTANRKFFKRFSLPHVKLHCNYDVLNKNQHQLFVGLSLGSLFFIYIPTFEQGILRQFGLTSSFRLTYSFVPREKLNRAVSLLPEAFAELGTVYSIERNIFGGESRFYHWGQNFCVGFRLSLKYKELDSGQSEL